VQAARDSSPENPPLCLALHVIGKTQARGINPPRLLDAKVVARKAKPWTQAQPCDIEPAHLVCRAAASSIGHLEHTVRKRTNCGKRPGIASQPQCLFQP